MVLKGTVRGMESHLCRQPSNCHSSGCHQSQGQGQVPLPLGGSMSWRSSGAMSQLCPLAITARLQTSPRSLRIRREEGFSPKRYLLLGDMIRAIYLLSSLIVGSCWMTVGFSRFLSRAGGTRGNSCSYLGTAQTSGLLHFLREGFSLVFGSAQHFALGCGTADTGLPAGSTLDMQASL